MVAVGEYPHTQIVRPCAQTVRAYAQTAECSLAVLRAVEVTVDHLGVETQMLEALSTAGSALVSALRSLESQVSPASPALDETGAMADALDVVADALRRRIVLCMEQCKNSDRNLAWGEIQRDLLRQAYEEHLDSLATTESVISALAGFLIGYELARESRSTGENRFDSALKLRQHIMAA